METEQKSKYELEKQERERSRREKENVARNTRIKKMLMRWSIWVLIIIVLGYGISLLIRSAVPQGEDFSIEYPIQGAEHISEVTSHPPYNSNPPSSGWHYDQPARGGFYSEPFQDERIVHNLEHGDIWIAYHPDISEEAVATIKSFAGSYVVVSPREENEDDISLVAWGRVDTFNIENGLIDKGRIRDFIRRYDNKGPEKVRAIQAGYF